MGRIRMNHDERHCHIIKSTAKLLAFHSPETLTTRRIAKSAGVSEALLY